MKRKQNEQKNPKSMPLARTVATEVAESALEQVSGGCRVTRGGDVEPCKQGFESQL